MPKASKSSTRKIKTRSARTKKVNQESLQISPEYREYLERFAEFGAGRPRLSPDEFDRLDDELLELLDQSGQPLSDDQIVRLQELEYLLIDSE